MDLQILSGHIVGRALMAMDLADGASLATVEGSSVGIQRMDGMVLVQAVEDGNVAKVVRADVKACNSVIHLIDAVLVPGDAELVEEPEEPAEACGDPFWQCCEGPQRCKSVDLACVEVDGAEACVRCGRKGEPVCDGVPLDCVCIIIIIVTGLK